MTARLSCCLAMLILLAQAGVASAYHGGPAFTDPAQAGPDFAVQGEYAGDLKIAGENKKVGVQVIALGKGEFSATLFHGGLPGDGWARHDKKDEAKGKTADGATRLAGHEWNAKITTGDSMSVTNSAGDSLGELKKVHRESPTLGAKPPAGAIVLFDGTTADAWNNGKIVEGNLLNFGPTSKKEFTDFTLHVEWREPFMPEARGQARANSGVYLQDRYEVQVLDSFGLEGKNDDCGGFYQIAPEKVNMSFPPLSWQTYDIDFTSARFDAAGKKLSDAKATVRHNGVLVHENLDLPHVTPGGINHESPGKGPIYLQDHAHDPLVFRNIWVVEKP